MSNELRAPIIAILFYTFTLFMCVVLLGIVIASIESKQKIIASTPAYCDYPPPKECKPYIEEMESWIKESMKSDKHWENCTRDLIRCQNEMNRDILCITPDCQ